MYMGSVWSFEPQQKLTSNKVLLKYIVMSAVTQRLFNHKSQLPLQFKPSKVRWNVYVRNIKGLSTTNVVSFA